MIVLTKLNSQIVALNPDLIMWIEVTPDTTISLLGGHHVIVRESLDEVLEKVIEFRRAIGGVLPRFEASIERIANSRGIDPHTHGIFRSPSEAPRR